MVKLIIFDLDGVLIESKKVHYDSLNNALKKISKSYFISQDEQLLKYEALSTKQKLDKLTMEKSLPVNLHSEIWQNKQNYTQKKLSKLRVDKDLVKFFKKIKKANIKVALASNSIRSTCELILKRIGIFDLIDFIVSNQDVKNPKPHPEMYWKCMIEFNTIPEETIIIEDSEVGKLGAKRSNANLIDVNSRDDIDLKFINSLINFDSSKTNYSSYDSENLNLLIPMAGLGSRFQTAGYTFPKPLIDVNGKTMIQTVLESINIKCKTIFIVQEEHFQKYNLKYFLEAISPNCSIVKINGITEGAACTSLLAKNLINNNKPLIIANSDQYIEWDTKNVVESWTKNKNIDGSMLTFYSNHPKWSYAKINKKGLVTKVAEKKPISNNATVGLYYWKNGSDYIKYAEKMIKKNIRTNNEFYICPVFNEAIKEGKTITISEVSKMLGLGTPEDLKHYLSKL